MKNRLLLMIVLLIPNVVFSDYNAGIGISVGTMGKDISVGVTLHNLIDSNYILNIYGAWEYRFWGIENWKPTGSIGFGFGYLKSLLRLNKPIYWDKEKKKYFRSLGVGVTADLEQKFSNDFYIGGRYGATVWGQLNRNMIGLGLGIDHTRELGVGMFGKIHYSILIGN